MAGIINPDVQMDTVEISKFYSDASNLNFEGAMATCSYIAPKSSVKKAQDMVHKDIKELDFGCGLIAPELMGNLHVLDLGSGAGKDCFVLSKLVGENGRVLGIDMTEDQVKRANQFVNYHTSKFGYKQPNVCFQAGEIEKLSKLGLQECSFDVVVSGCVISLSQDKKAVFSEAYKVLKWGGEMYFSDMYSEKDVSDDLKADPVYWCEGLSGSLKWKEFLDIVEKVGFTQPRIVHLEWMSLRDDAKQKIGNNRYISATVRLFKLPPNLEDSLPFYNNKIIYKGGIEDAEESFTFDIGSKLHKNEPIPVDKNLWVILKNSRYADFFQFLEEPKSQNHDLAANDPFKFLDITSCT